MDTHKLKVRVGQHEFEAEGTQEAVEKQFEAFKDLVKIASNNPGLQGANAPGGTGNNTLTTPLDGDLRLETVVKLDGDKVSLTAHPTGQDPDGEAVLLILLGYKLLLATDQVSGIQLLAGMTQSGFQIDRVDRIVARLPEGQVIRTGAKTGVKYRLTNSGLARAKEVTRALVATLT